MPVSITLATSSVSDRFLIFSAPPKYVRLTSKAGSSVDLMRVKTKSKQPAIRSRHTWSSKVSVLAWACRAVWKPYVEPWRDVHRVTIADSRSKDIKKGACRRIVPVVDEPDSVLLDRCVESLVERGSVSIHALLEILVISSCEVQVVSHVAKPWSRWALECGDGSMATRRMPSTKRHQIKIYFWKRKMMVAQYLQLAILPVCRCQNGHNRYDFYDSLITVKSWKANSFSSWFESN